MPNTPNTDVELSDAPTPVGSRDAWMINLDGEVDAAAVARLRHEVVDALTGYDRIVVGLRNVSVLSTSTLALLCGALRQAHRPGATLVVADGAPAANRALELCALPGVELRPLTASAEALAGAHR
ncbi:MAG: STAS domain-containing protein [Solirubrobacteraceae bacterium]|nr:STAS domain-containing protein [Solirubrobacteraceae bacterium]